MKRRFEQNQIDCTFTVLALLPTATENIIAALPVEQLTHELQEKKAERLARAAEGAQSELSSAPSSIRDGDTASLTSFQTGSFIHASQLAEDPNQPRLRKSKAQLWNEIKITSMTRACTLIYTLSLLTLLTRIQLNLLGRLSYVTSVILLAQPPTPERSNSISLEDHDDTNPNSHSTSGHDFETNRRYLTFSWHLLNRGYAQIQAKVEEAVKEIFGSISPTEAITPARLSDLILAIRRKVEGATEHERYATRWLPYLLPPQEDEASLLIESGVITPPPSSSANSSPGSEPNATANISPSSYYNTANGPLRNLLDETADLIDSPTFTRIHTMVLNTLFSHLIDTKVAEQAFSKPTEAPFDPSATASTMLATPTPATSEPKVKLATILAVLTRQAHAIGRGNSSSTPTPLGASGVDLTTAQDADATATATTNEYLALVDAQVKELEAFAAVIYAHNLHNQDEMMKQSFQTQPQPALPESSTAGQQTVENSGANTGAHSGGRAAASMENSSVLEGAWSRIVGGSSSFSSR